MGLIDPDRYLGGRVQLSADLAERSLQPLAERFGWSSEEAAAAVHDLVVANMANALREVSVEKGYDPREFTFLAYGGTLPLFAVQIADRLGIRNVVIPENSSVFCARGLLTSDFILRNHQTVSWDLSQAAEVDRVNEATERLIEAGRSDMLSQGFDEGDVSIERSADFRFVGQSFELTMTLPDRPLSADDAPDLAEQFYTLYERTYGEGTAWQGVPELLLNTTVTVVGQQPRPSMNGGRPAPRDASEIEMGRREIYLPDSKTRREVTVYDDGEFTVGSAIEGPAIVDATDTTIYVPAGTRAERDQFRNYVLSRS
jgi:N-methylhydantoinase A